MLNGSFLAEAKSEHQLQSPLGSQDFSTEVSSNSDNSDSTPLSEDSVNEQENVTKSKKGKRSASKRLQRSNERVKGLEQHEKELEKKIQQLQAAQNDTATQLQAKDEKIKDLETANKKALETKTEESQVKDKKIKDLEVQLNNQPDAAQLKAKDEKINKLNDEVQKLQAAPNDTAAQLKAKDEEITQLKAQVQQLQNATLKDSQQTAKQIKTLTDQVQQLQEEKEDLEAKNKTTEQPKQGNGARYTATVGVGLAAGLVAFTALERTVKLEMLAMVSIVVVSALAFGVITYTSTQVNGAEAQGLDGVIKGSNKS